MHHPAIKYNITGILNILAFSDCFFRVLFEGFSAEIHVTFATLYSRRMMMCRSVQVYTSLYTSIAFVAVAFGIYHLSTSCLQVVVLQHVNI